MRFNKKRKFSRNNTCSTCSEDESNDSFDEQKKKSETKRHLDNRSSTSTSSSLSDNGYNSVTKYSSSSCSSKCNEDSCCTSEDGSSTSEDSSSTSEDSSSTSEDSSCTSSSSNSSSSESKAIDSNSQKIKGDGTPSGHNYPKPDNKKIADLELKTSTNKELLKLEQKNSVENPPVLSNLMLSMAKNKKKLVKSMLNKKTTHIKFQEDEAECEEKSTVIVNNGVANDVPLLNSEKEIIDHVGVASGVNPETQLPEPYALFTQVHLTDDVNGKKRKRKRNRNKNKNKANSLASSEDDSKNKTFDVINEISDTQTLIDDAASEKKIGSNCNFTELELLDPKAPIVVGQKICFRNLELSQECVPILSDWKEAKIIKYFPTTGLTKLELLNCTTQRDTEKRLRKTIANEYENFEVVENDEFNFKYTKLRGLKAFEIQDSDVENKQKDNQTSNSRFLEVKLDELSEREKTKIKSDKKDDIPSRAPAINENLERIRSNFDSSKSVDLEGRMENLQTDCQTGNSFHIDIHCLDEGNVSQVTVQDTVSREFNFAEDFQSQELNPVHLKHNASVISELEVNLEVISKNDIFSEKDKTHFETIVVHDPFLKKKPSVETLNRSLKTSMVEKKLSSALIEKKAPVITLLITEPVVEKVPNSVVAAADGLPRREKRMLEPCELYTKGICLFTEQVRLKLVLLNIPHTFTRWGRKQPPPAWFEKVSPEQTVPGGEFLIDPTEMMAWAEKYKAVTSSTNSAIVTYWENFVKNEFHTAFFNVLMAPEENIQEEFRPKLLEACNKLSDQLRGRSYVEYFRDFKILTPELDLYAQALEANEFYSKICLPLSEIKQYLCVNLPKLSPITIVNLQHLSILRHFENINQLVIKLNDDVLLSDQEKLELCKEICSKINCLLLFIEEHTSCEVEILFPIYEEMSTGITSRSYENHFGEAPVLESLKTDIRIFLRTLNYTSHVKFRSIFLQFLPLVSRVQVMGRNLKLQIQLENDTFSEVSRQVGEKDSDICRQIYYHGDSQLQTQYLHNIESTVRIVDPPAWSHIQRILKNHLPPDQWDNLLDRVPALDQDDFRKFLEGKPQLKREKKEEKKKKKEVSSVKKEDFLPKKVKERKNAAVDEDVNLTPKIQYRDRARERREGKNLDYKDSDHIISILNKNSNQIEASKYLEGSQEHTHLVKGLDYTLLRKNKEGLKNLENNANDEEEDDELEIEDPKQLKFKSKKNQEVFNLAYNFDENDSNFLKTENEFFFPGRMCFEFDLQGNNPVKRILRNKIQMKDSVILTF
ncbi:Smu-2 suppressor of mec-8 and unc-52 protein [Clydaea vesicula]|uniref:Smu-2 suppressor of mec-8 and unc-52 protein n=1 Tax=Clydaea vesicula TaxID=447962 RepID=A0AAD5XV11_9FUNG|nr:Smu-2 suppressor of mec-8 and unc-52 protein [Clydaea vesicula]